MRKPIAISESNNFTLVICDDGTIWQHRGTGFSSRDWRRLPDIPQDEPMIAPEPIKAFNNVECKVE